jgi:hypothetical protein
MFKQQQQVNSIIGELFNHYFLVIIVIYIYFGNDNDDDLLFKACSCFSFEKLNF